MAHRQMYSMTRRIKSMPMLYRFTSTARHWSTARNPPPPPNNVLRFVEDYWAIISNYVREPGKLACIIPKIFERPYSNPFARLFFIQLNYFKTSHTRYCFYAETIKHCHLRRYSFSSQRRSHAQCGSEELL